MRKFLMVAMAAVAVASTSLLSADSKSGLPNATPPVREAAPMPRTKEAADFFRVTSAAEDKMYERFMASFVQDAPPKPVPNPKKFPRGLKPTPKHKLFAIPQFTPGKSLVARPASVAYVPAKLSMWLNDQYGDCVTAESAFNQAACGTFITDATVMAFARKYNLLNGAELPQVLDLMISNGFSQGGKTYGSGSYFAVDFSNEGTLQDSICIAPVDIAIDANALTSGAGNNQGWYAVGGRVGEYSNTDHCVSIAGYGDAKTLYAALNVPLPAAIQPTKTGYLLFTWSTIGFVDHDWIMSTCTEAYIRNPAGTVNKQPVPNPGPGPNPPVPPTPPQPPVPPVPTPPTPGPTSGVSVLIIGNTVTASNGTDSVTIDFGMKKITEPSTWTVGGPTASQALEAEFKGAGVSPAIIIDVLKLVSDVKAKAGFSVILADVMQIITDLKG